MGMKAETVAMLRRELKVAQAMEVDSNQNVARAQVRAEYWREQADQLRAQLARLGVEVAR